MTCNYPNLAGDTYSVWIFRPRSLDGISPGNQCSRNVSSFFSLFWELAGFFLAQTKFFLRRNNQKHAFVTALARAMSRHRLYLLRQEQIRVEVFKFKRVCAHSLCYKSQWWLDAVKLGSVEYTRPWSILVGSRPNNWITGWWSWDKD